MKMDYICLVQTLLCSICVFTEHVGERGVDTPMLHIYSMQLSEMQVCKCLFVQYCPSYAA